MNTTKTATLFDHYAPNDTITFEYDRAVYYGFDLEYGGLQTGQYRIPFGLMIGYGDISRHFRDKPKDSVTIHSDDHAILEPWIGIRLDRGVKKRIWRVPMRMFSLVLGYRLPISPDHEDYDWEDLAGPVLYLRFSP